MAAQQQGEEDDKQTNSPSASSWGEMIGLPFRKVKDHIEANPYVWTAYVVVYGGFGLWLTYRWTKLRRTEDRVRVLQEKLRKLHEARERELAASAGAVEKATSIEKASGNKSPE